MYLADLTWLQARDVLTPGSLVLLPLGAAAKEHGPHLRLDNDRVLADYLARRIDTLEQVVVAPTLNYHYYPAFAAYAGSTSLRMETARDMVTEIVASLAAFGPRRFYVLNTGISTVHALQPAAAALASQGILMRYTDIDLAGNGPLEEVGCPTFCSLPDFVVRCYSDDGSQFFIKKLRANSPDQQQLFNRVKC